MYAPRQSAPPPVERFLTRTFVLHMGVCNDGTQLYQTRGENDAVAREVAAAASRSIGDTWAAVLEAHLRVLLFLSLERYEAAFQEQEVVVRYEGSLYPGQTFCLSTGVLTHIARSNLAMLHRCETPYSEFMKVFEPSQWGKVFKLFLKQLRCVAMLADERGAQREEPLAQQAARDIQRILLQLQQDRAHQLFALYVACQLFRIYFKVR